MASAGAEQVGVQHRLLLWIDALAARLNRLKPEPVAQHLVTGLRGEEEALFYLKRRGYTIVARRWKTPKLFGDVDLIAWDGETLCFIEVKTRTGRNIVPAEYAVDGQKQRMLRQMAAAFRHRFPEKLRRAIPFRFDVVSVYLGGDSAEIELFKDAFSRFER